MSIKDILVVCDGGAGSDNAIRYGLTLAEAWDAHLSGVLTHGVSQLMGHMGAWAPEETFAVLAEHDAKVRAEIRARFEELTAPAGRTGKIHYLDISGDPDAMLVRTARCFDLIVMGPREDGAEQAHFRPHPDVIALRGGRPVLYVPDGSKSAGAPARAVLAWDGRDAAARAMAEALPILATVDRVSVVSVGDPDSQVAMSNASAVRHLMRHGVRAEGRVIAKENAGIARTLMSAALYDRSDILVMGAYEHSKLAEDIFGGVTNSILAEAELPVFLTH